MKSYQAVVELLSSTCLAALFPSISVTDTVGGLNLHKPGNLLHARGSNAKGSNNPENAVVSQKDAPLNLVVIDSGIRLSHQEFKGRATFDVSFSKYAGETDVKGNGTHIAGIIGGATYGVAKKVQMIAVKIDVNETQMIKAADFVLQDVKKRGIQGKAVVSMLMHVDASDEVDKKFRQLTDSGIVCVVSAGNNFKDAGQFSPGRDPNVITVAAMDEKYDTYWDVSNYGSSIDLWAPGANITSAHSKSDIAVAAHAGTSQATPHVSGLAAYVMALENITNPKEVATRLKALAKQSGASLKWPVPNTTNLIASNGIDKKLYNATRVQKILWIKANQHSDSPFCGEIYADAICGTQRMWRYQ
ncbi:hypothetical protein QQS21_007437 [Conoideocrella luteorostrata]|uniref:Peptidase S8/S53 domain-containing protein n=1 Tax=Conoideocrella luteorostrata TaxID=1105319 RepID=A0AAJ0CKV3_9HYPO|nr:hypothetical protein QQS21_007437 [Conoideocrella luteorostrata]